MSLYHFTSGTPPDSTFSDIRALDSFNDKLFNEVVTITMTYLAETQKLTWLISQLEEVSHRHTVGLADLKSITRTLLNILKSGLRLKLDSQLIKKDFISLGLSEEKSSYLSDQWKVNQTGMLTSVFHQTLTVNRLIDMDWKFGVTAASSTLDKVGNTFLQLKLTIDKGHGTENICMELTLPQFYSFLHEMEQAKAAMDYAG